MTATTQDGIRPAQPHLVDVLLEGWDPRSVERRPTGTEVATARYAWMLALDTADQLLAAGVSPTDVDEIHRRLWASVKGAPWLELLRVFATVYLDARPLDGAE